MTRKTAAYLAVAGSALVAVVLATWVVTSDGRRFGEPMTSATPNHGQAAREFGGRVGFTVDVTQVDRESARLVLHLTFRNTSSEQQRANPADFRLEDATGWHAAPVFEAPCADWGRVDLYPPGATSQPLRDPNGTRAGATWLGTLCFPEPPGESAALTLVWEPDVAFGPLSVPVRISLR